MTHTDSYKGKAATHTTAAGKAHDKTGVNAAENQEKFSMFVFLCKFFSVV